MKLSKSQRRSIEKYRAKKGQAPTFRIIGIMGAGRLANILGIEAPKTPLTYEQLPKEKLN